VDNLIGRGTSKPKKETTLKRSIQSLFTETLKDVELDALLQGLQSKDYINLLDGNVTYNLPKKNSVTRTA
jgi:hypothetical protein